MFPGKAMLLCAAMLAAGARGAAAQDSLVARFYQARAYRLAWSDAGGVSPQAVALLAILLRADAEGLDPADYRSPALDSMVHPPRTIFEAWRVDSLLTVSFFAYARDVSLGRVDPARADSVWTAAPRTTDFVRLLEDAIDSGRVAATLYDLAPPQPGYAALRRALARYRDLAARGDWPTEPGERLAAEGYDTAGGLTAAVRAFQEAHGITPDGEIGPVTRAALDVSAAARAGQIALNLERWRWLPPSLGERYIIVNSAAFTLDLVDHDTAAIRMRAIVGRPDWPTPIASSRATQLLFRPPWNLPRTIAVKEVLPQLRRDPSYLAREGMRVFDHSGREIAPRSIDWRSVTESTFAYQLVQDPGPANPLGGVKLVFGTPFNVFIHDTPARSLFSEPWRAFSHGCVRVEHAADLAAYLLPDWPADSIRAAMRRGAWDRWSRIPEPIPVHLVYWTAWADGSGEAPVSFRGDTYGWDERLARALSAARPGAPRLTSLDPPAERPAPRSSSGRGPAQCNGR